MGVLVRVTGQRGSHLRVFSVWAVIVCASSRDIPFAHVLLWVSDHRASVEPAKFFFFFNLALTAERELRETLQWAVLNAGNTHRPVFTTV